MLNLLRNGEVIRQVVPGSSFTHGLDTTSPAYAGWDNGEYELVEAPPAPELEPIALTPDELRAYAAQKRWEMEVGGIVVHGLTVATDDRSKTMISGARVAAQSDPEFSTQWKSADGTFATIDAAAVIAISDAMLAHVSNCFALEARTLALIDAGEITTPKDIDDMWAAAIG